MMRLVRNGLMFGNLVEVTATAIVGRYNRALKHLIGKETALTEFHIDISGYSPEIGEEFGDPRYLNQNGCNRQFILLTTDQKSAPLLNAHFSTSRSILRDYIDDNEEELFALTAREAIAGEILNSVYEIKSPHDLLKINKSTIEADTIQEHVASAKVLQGHIDEFMTKDDAWWDDVLIAQMIELAKSTGNIQRNPVSLKSDSYEQGNFYTSHFGGVYVFRDIKTPTIILRDSTVDFGDLPNFNILTFEDRKHIAALLFRLNLAELIVDKDDDAGEAVIRQKIDFIQIATAASAGDDLGDLNRRQMRDISRRYASIMPAEYHGLMRMLQWSEKGGRFPDISPDDASWFYAWRSTQHHDKDLVNMLLADLSPLDFRQLFICHKDAFYEAYRNYPDAKKDYVVKFLAEEYVFDKVGARELLFGNEPRMEEPESTYTREDYDEPSFKGPLGERLSIKNGLIRVKPTKNKKNGLREDLDWDKSKYKNKKNKKNKKHKKDWD